MGVILEFSSTCTWGPRVDDFSQQTITFRLAGVHRECTVLELAWRAHIYTEEETADPHFLPFLAACTTHLDEGVTEAAIWVEIINIAFTTSATASTIRSPIDRLLHRIVACTLAQHKGGDKVPKKDLPFLLALLRATRGGVEEESIKLRGGVTGNQSKTFLKNIFISFFGRIIICLDGN